MNKVILLAVMVFFFCQCRNDGGTKEPTARPEAKKNSLAVSIANSNDYQKLMASDLALSPVGRLCAESKGYKIDEWDALNECSWAVEKHQLEKYPDLISRTDAALQIKTADNVLTLTHELTEPSTYYQFIDYLPNSNYFVIKVIQQSNCLQYWLVRAGNGQKTVLPGRPVFTTTKDAFLLSAGVGSESGNCPNSVSLWSLQDDLFQELITLKTKGVIRNLYWEKGMTWLGKRGEEVVRIEHM